MVSHLSSKLKPQHEATKEEEEEEDLLLLLPNEANVCSYLQVSLNQVGDIYTNV
jgi:hypothetical protein